MFAHWAKAAGTGVLSVKFGLAPGGVDLAAGGALVRDGGTAKEGCGSADCRRSRSRESTSSSRQGLEQELPVEAQELFWLQAQNASAQQARHP